MKNRTNEERALQLGMPFGTATHRLRKSILFSFVQRLNEDVCFKCSKKIETIEELSIEHKKPWFNKDINLFWDLDNIAFSHLKCNIRDTPYNPPNKIICPPNTAWCYKCKDFQPIDNFHVNTSKWNGLSSACKPHHLELTNARKKAVRSKI